MSARRVRFALVIVAALLCLVPVLGAQESSHARIVRLSYVDGNIQIDRNAGQGNERAILNMPIVQGTRLTAGEDGKVEIEFENGSTARLIGPGAIYFRELSLRGNGDKVSLLELQHGIAYFDIQHKGGDDFRVSVDDHAFQVRKSSQFRIDSGLTSDKISVTKGELQLVGVPDEVAVKKNETLTFESSDPAKYELAKGVEPLNTDEWNSDREDDKNTLASSEQYHNNLNYYGGPYNYGTYDMARYGNWYSAPGYGWLWRPYYMDPMYASDPYFWNPYSNGAWSYYPGIGWTFVSMYPWGWTPYRYGSWLFVPGFGWSWRPGGYNSWQTAPAIVNPPANYTLPKPPTRPGPTVPVPGKALMQPLPSSNVGGLGSARKVDGKPATLPPVTTGKTPAATTRTGDKPAGTITPEPMRTPSNKLPDPDKVGPGDVNNVRQPAHAPRPAAPSAPARTAPAPSAPAPSAPAPAPAPAPHPHSSTSTPHASMSHGMGSMGSMSSGGHASGGSGHSGRVH